MNPHSMLVFMFTKTFVMTDPLYEFGRAGFSFKEMDVSVGNFTYVF